MDTRLRVERWGELLMLLCWLFLRWTGEGFLLGRLVRWAEPDFYCW